MISVLKEYLSKQPYKTLHAVKHLKGYKYKPTSYDLIRVFIKHLKRVLNDNSYHKAFKELRIKTFKGYTKRVTHKDLQRLYSQPLKLKKSLKGYLLRFVTRY